MLLMLRICSNKDEEEKELELGKEEVCMDVWGASYKSHLQRRWQEEEGWSERLINYADLKSLSVEGGYLWHQKSRFGSFIDTNSMLLKDSEMQSDNWKYWE